MSKLKKLLISDKEAKRLKAPKEYEDYRPDPGVFAIGLTKKELRILLFWASVGVAKLRGGSYAEIAPKMITYFARHLDIKLPVKPQFRTYPKPKTPKSIKSSKTNRR